MATDNQFWYILDTEYNALLEGIKSLQGGEIKVST
jgi:hypothetical protein